MNKILILFDSASGNTRTMATLIAEGAGTISGTEVRLRHIDEATADDVLWCDGLALGSPTNMGLMSWKMKKFWDVTMMDHWMAVDGKIGCAFSSAGGFGGGQEMCKLPRQVDRLEVEEKGIGCLVVGCVDLVLKVEGGRLLRES